MPVTSLFGYTYTRTQCLSRNRVSAVALGGVFSGGRQKVPSDGEERDTKVRMYYSSAPNTRIELGPGKRPNGAMSLPWKKELELGLANSLC